MQNEYKDIEDYGIIGNLETCAIVGSDGSNRLVMLSLS